MRDITRTKLKRRAPEGRGNARLRRAAGFVLALLVCLALVACQWGGRSPAEMERLQAAAINAMLSELGEDRTLRLASGDTLQLSAATLEFYRGRGGQGAWTGRGGVLSDQGQALHEAIGDAWQDGLPPERYRHDVASALLAALEGKDDDGPADSLVVRYRAGLDVLLTEGIDRLERDLVMGMLDPAEVGLDYRIVTDPPPEGTLLRRLAAGESPADLVAALRPTMPQYELMRTALVAFREAELRGGWPRVAADTATREGARGAGVAQLRERLVVGVDLAEARLARNGLADPEFFDPDLAGAVRHFQERHALEPDGVVGATTVRELNQTASERVAELQLNLDRWRWLPHDLGARYVLVNIAGFELEVVDQGRVIEAMDVVVGQRDLETPIFADSIRYVVVNPYWNVPDGIMARTITPGIAADPDYLAAHDMEIVDGRVRQRPGPKNSLGRYKFIFPNDFDVYLHDTPDGHLFARTERAFSSGCVRIERPRDFARMLLTLQSSQDPESLDGLVAAGSEQWLQLDRPLPVYLLYFTAWARTDGTVRFHHDVYARNDALGDQGGEEGASPGSRRPAEGGEG